MRTTTERREAIINRLNREGTVKVLALAKAFNVTKVTIRNDLDYLEQKDLLVRSHGGAMQKPVQFLESTNSLKGQQHLPEKKRIGKKARDLIFAGDAIVLSAGTTTEQVVKGLTGIENLFLLTNGLNILTAIGHMTGITAVCTGGNFHQDSLSFSGFLAEESLEKYNLDKMIVGVDGIHIDQGITTHSEHEARFYNAVLKATRKCIVLADSSKFGKVSVHKIMPCAKIDVLITDDGINSEYQQRLTKLGVEVIVV